MNSRAQDVLFRLAGLFAVLGVLFACAAGLGYLVRQAAGLSLCFLLRRADRQGASVRVPGL